MDTLRRRDFMGLLAAAGTAGVARSQAQSPRTDATPAPYDVVVLHNVRIPMRDGVRLAADVYLPAKDGRALDRKLPALLMRTPYDRTVAFVRQVRYFAERGYISVTQDCRGRFGSEGRFEPFRQEAADGYDTIAWVARHPSCDGRVGMHGVSYMAWTQYEAAALAPPSLTAMAPHCGPINAYAYSMHVGGTLTLGLLKWHLYMASTSQEAARDPIIASALATMSEGDAFLRWAMALPWRRGQTPLALAPAYEDSAFALYFDHPDYDEFWRAPGLAMDEYLAAFPDVPTLSIVGWYEVYTRSVVDSFQRFTATKRGPHYLVIGPWTHANTRASCGDANFGAAASQIPDAGDLPELLHRWFNRWVRGDASAPLGAPVKIFIMGGGDGRRGEGGRINHGGRWHADRTWPPPASRPVRWYLHEGGRLDREAAAVRRASTAYTYDPRNTVSSDGRCEIAYGPAADKAFEGMGPLDQIQLATLPGHGTPGAPIAQRGDVLVFHTAPLAEDLVIAGNITARLFVSSDAPDTDFYLKLIDEHPPTADYPTGYAFPLTDGVLRARYREGFVRPRPLDAAVIYELIIPIQPVANQFMRGHRLRLDISSSSFPNFEPNRNTGRPHDRAWRFAQNVIHHDAYHASSIELSVMA